MKKIFFIFSLLLQVLICLLLSRQIFAQGYDKPLDIQGLDNRTLQSAASRAAGGTTIGIKNDVSLMFTNPASLQSLTGIQISVGGLLQYSKASQVQQYTPLKYYSNFSLLMEGLTGGIINPDSLHPGSNPGDTVQRPFDNIGPNWSRSKNKNLPVQALLAVPFTLGKINFVIGVGAVEYANLNHYYQNNNVLFPSIGSQRPIPIPLPPNNPDSTFKTEWSQYYRSRDGSINGYGIAFSGALSQKISLGISGMLLKGTTDDLEQRLGRGRFVFYQNYFRLDSVNFNKKITQTGTSDFSGQEFTFSGIYRGNYVSFGFSVKPPTTIKRDFSTQIRIDTIGSSSISSISGQDEIQLPWRGTVGMSIGLLKNLTLGLEYELRPYESTIYKNTDSKELKPWLSASVFHVGVNYNPLSWLLLRAGMRGHTEVFEPEGNPLAGEPVSFSIYSVGCGILYAGINLNITYEYSLMKYQDMWQTNVNLNKETCHNIMADVRYEIPWNR
ncbi:MAG: hypothetical protein QME58_12055 [Bacteroidota bacterium]|nr:hypothetical protein [Bacteroidota bacterium]